MSVDLTSFRYTRAVVAGRRVRVPSMLSTAPLPNFELVTSGSIVCAHVRGRTRVGQTLESPEHSTDLVEWLNKIEWDADAIQQSVDAWIKRHSTSEFYFVYSGSDGHSSLAAGGSMLCIDKKDNIHFTPWALEVAFVKAKAIPS